MNISDRELERYGETFLQSFESIRRALALYPGNHPKVGEQLARFVRNLHDLYDHVGEATFNVIHQEFFINGLPLKRLSLNYAKSILTWENLGLGLVRFSKDTSPESALRFFETLSRSPEEIAASGGLPALLSQAGIQGIRVTSVASELEGHLVPVFEEIALQGVEASTPEEARTRFYDSKAELSAMVDRAWGTTSNPARMVRTATFLIDKRITERHVVAGLLDKLRAHHEPSWRHAIDGAVIAVLMGRALGLARDRMSQLGEAAVLRDIGKLALPLEVLQGAEARDETRETYRRHPALGAKMLVFTRDVDPGAAIVALEHHARFDGRGFPKLRARKGPHALSRIVAVASDYDRYTGEAAGEGRLTPAEAMRRLVKDSGAAYAPAAVRALLSVVGLFPEGSAVELRDGRYGVVAGPGDSSWSQPEVAILKDASGTEVEPFILRTKEIAAGSESTIASIFIPTRDDAERVAVLRIA